MLTSICTKYWHFFLAQTLLGGMSIGLIFTPGMAIVSHYFHKKRALAVGVVVAGSSIGGAIFPIMMNQLLYSDHLSFGWSVRICGFVILVGLAFAAAVIKPRLPPGKHSFDKALLRSPVYYLSVIGIWLLNWGFTIPIFYLPSFAVSRGMSPDLAQYTVAILNATSLFGRVFVGMLADGYGRYNMIVLVSIASGVLLFCWQSVSSNAGIIVFSAFTGLCTGALISLYPACMVQITPDPRNSGAVMGISTTILAFSQLTGAPIAGAILAQSGFTQVGNFVGAVMLGGGLVMAAARVAGQPKLSQVF